MTFSQSLNILSSNCVVSVDRNCVLLLLLFFLPTLIDKDKILLCCVMSCQTSPSSTRTTLQQKKPLPKSIITINMCALQNHTVRHERHRSSINNVSSLHLVLMLQSWNLVFSYNTVWLHVLSNFFPRGDKAVCASASRSRTPAYVFRIWVHEPLFCSTVSLVRFFFSFLWIPSLATMPSWCSKYQPMRAWVKKKMFKSSRKFEHSPSLRFLTPKIGTISKMTPHVEVGASAYLLVESRDASCHMSGECGLGTYPVSTIQGIVARQSGRSPQFQRLWDWGRGRDTSKVGASAYFIV